MMKTILLTGLDGSGKSTQLKRLKEKGERLDIIFVPHIKTQDLEGNLLQAALFVNQLSHEADQQKIPQLKGIALFASMILFRQLMTVKASSSLDYLFFERHPLIDTGIYARFYASKLGPNSLDSAIINSLDKQYANELAYLLELIPPQFLKDRTPSFSTFLNLIFQRFHIEKKYSIPEMIELFQVSLPDEIYFLRATPEVLYDRIKDREVKEVHESVEVFRKLDAVYFALLNGLQNQLGLKIHMVNANETSELEALSQHFSKMIHES